jgi:redox-sensing transcriptional repressor
MATAADNTKVISRLSRYRRALLRLQSEGNRRVVSTMLGHEIGAAASQVRKDFSVFGISGNKKGGYGIDSILLKLEAILGKNRVREVIVVGCGNIGQALINFGDFENEGIRILAGFDQEASKWRSSSNVPVLPVEQCRDFIREHRIKVAIIAVPERSAQEVCNMLTGAGIEGILTFASIRLMVGEGVVVNYVNIYAKLENLLYFVDGFGKKHS